eukprot:TRINITY_DN2256_c0_g1_i3.p1 TRINITY_DN2256_c0_g1~~TRINITY_DN2256_c0_g1_i3.p1  ORF type:complete len:261 (+),score=18.49 TRINITY_DN2256_c0_g1_i3:55-837(+)
MLTGGSLTTSVLERSSNPPIFPKLSQPLRRPQHNVSLQITCCQKIEYETKKVFHGLEQSSYWEAQEEQDIFLSSAPGLPLSPTWKMMLLTDGSVTHHLQTMTGLPVEVDCLESKILSQSDLRPNNGFKYTNLPKEVQFIPGQNILQRQVLLRIPDDKATPYVYASSWWDADTVDQFLQDKKLPIWKSLSKERTEIYRDIHRVFRGTNKQVEEYFGVEGDEFWGRQYYFWHKGKVLTVIYEVFSTKLERFLGPQCHDYLLP